jgi:hypothetical protein
MLPHTLQQLRRASVLLSLCFTVTMAPLAAALDSFRSIDNRLPNPDRPYDMTSGTVVFLSSPPFAIYDLQFRAANPSQLDLPTLKDGNWEFDSFFDISYKAVVSTSLEPAHTVTGAGTAHAKGIAPAGANPQVFDTELVALNLVGLSPNSAFRFRESLTSPSSGVTTREDLCPQCAAPVTYWRISSFFDIFAEVSFNGGDTWTPGDKAIHVEQLSDPVTEADFNGDGTVDAPDYVTWRRGDGSIYADSDYDLWRAHFDQTVAGNGTANAALVGVPEPSTCWLLAIAAVRSLFRRQKKYI